MAKYQKYAEYKDSGVRWLGFVPSHWVVAGFKKYLESTVDYRGKTPEKMEEGIFLVTARNIKNGIIDYSLSQEYVAIKDYDEIMSRGKPLLGDVLFTTEAPLGEVAQIDNVNIALAQRIIKFRGKNNILDNTYLKYFILSQQFQDSLMTFATGSTALGIKAERLGYLQQYIPPIHEQLKIANFLDHETSKIDTLISKQEKLIELLKEKRQAVISHAVIKGLNPNVAMKDSGVEWLGEVPEHWVICRLKNVLSIKNGRDYKNVEIEEGGYPVYGSGGIFKRSSEYLYDGISILFGRKGTVDKPLLVSGKFWTVDTMFYSELGKNVNPEYVYFQSLGFPFDKLSTNTALPSMTQEDLLNLGFALPPVNEQFEISKFITQYLEKNHSLMEKAKQAIQLMQERRTSLISAAVTGKIDVRNWQNPNKNKEEDMELRA